MVRRAELLGDPLIESNFPPIADGDHFPHQRGFVVSIYLPIWHLALHGTLSSPTSLTLELLCYEHVRQEHAIDAGQPTNRLSYYYSRH